MTNSTASVRYPCKHDCNFPSHLQDGSITCRRREQLCARANCIDPVLDPDTCCPVCRNETCSYAGRQYRDGQLVPASRDVCEECHCTNGLIDCARKQCPPVTCRNPGRDQCCHTCNCKCLISFAFF